MKISEEVMKYAVSAVMEETESDLPMNEINAIDDITVDEKELEIIEKDIQSENKKEEEKEMKTVEVLGSIAIKGVEVDYSRDGVVQESLVKAAAELDLSVKETLDLKKDVERRIEETISIYKLESVLNNTQLERVIEKVDAGRIFRNAEDFAEVKGIGPKTVQSIKEMLGEVEIKETTEATDEAVDEIVNIVNEDIPKLDKEEKNKVKQMNRKEKKNKLAPKYFDMDINSKSEATIKGIYYKGRYGIEITNFKASITTNSNRADYNKVTLFFGDKTDGWDVWGRYSGSLVKGENKARFEFYKTGKNISVTYWRMNEYKVVAKKLAVAAINKLYKAYKK